MSKPKALRYVVKKASNRIIWRPKGGTDRMRGLGLREVFLCHAASIKDIDAAAFAKAAELNAQWDRLRHDLPKGSVPEKQTSGYATGTIGYAMVQAMAWRAAKRGHADKQWDKDQQKRDDWPRAFKQFKTVKLDRMRPAEVPTSFFLTKDGKTGFIPYLEREISQSERYRVIKVWRALCNLMSQNLDMLGTGKLLTAPDPTATLDNPPPPKREARWQHGEVLRLVEHAWVTERKGLSALMAIAWDTMLSPIDVRTLTRAKMRRDPVFGLYFAIKRTKTGRPGVGTLTDWSVGILRAYLEALKVEPLEDMPLFYTPGTAPGIMGGRRYAPQPYSKDLVEKHFRAVRIEVFGPGEDRTLADFRRSGAYEGDAGGASVEDQANKMANRIDVNEQLRQHYNPVNLAAAKRFDQHREMARATGATEPKLVEQQTQNKKVSRRRSEKVSPLLLKRAKSLK